jgi:hypothetical protein
VPTVPAAIDYRLSRCSSYLTSPCRAAQRRSKN